MDGRLGRPHDVILRRPQDVESRRPQDVSSERPWDGQIGSLEDVLGMLERDVLGTSWGLIFAGWDVVHIITLKQAFNNGLIILKKVHRVIQFSQKAWLKPYIDMKIKLSKEAKNNFEKDFFKLMNNAVFGKAMKNVMENHRDIKIVTINKQRNKLASEPNYHTTKRISKDFLIMEMK